MGATVESTTISIETHKAMGSTLQMEQATPETPAAIVSGRSNSMMTGSGEGLSLPLSHALSFKGDSKSLFEEGWNSVLRVDVELTEAKLANSKPSLLPICPPCLPERVANSTPRFIEASLPEASPNS